MQRRLSAEWRAVHRLGGRADERTVPDLTPETTEVWDEVRKLPRRQAQAIALHYVDQLSVEEIGQVMGCSSGAVKSHLHRARARLSERLQTWDEEAI
jgi:RNA polymerase sigma-70 factor (ECF subfamily)